MIKSSRETFKRVKFKEQYPKDIYSRLLSVKGLSLGEKVIIMFLGEYAWGADNNRFPTYKELADTLEVSERTIMRKVDLLIEKKIIIPAKVTKGQKDHWFEIDLNGFLFPDDKKSCDNVTHKGDKSLNKHDKSKNKGDKSQAKGDKSTDKGDKSTLKEPLYNKSNIKNNQSKTHISKDTEIKGTTTTTITTAYAERLKALEISDPAESDKFVSLFKGTPDDVIDSCIDHYLKQKSTTKIHDPYSYFKRIVDEALRQGAKKKGIYDKSNLPRSRCCHALTFVDTKGAIKCAACDSKLDKEQDLINVEEIKGEPEGPKNVVDLDKVKMFQPIGPGPGQGIDIIVDPDGLTFGKDIRGLRFSCSAFGEIAQQNRHGQVPPNVVFIKRTKIVGYKNPWVVYSPVPPAR